VDEPNIGPNIGHGMKHTYAVEWWTEQLDKLVVAAEEQFTVEESVTALFYWDMYRKRLDKLQAFPKRYRDGVYG